MYPQSGEEFPQELEIHWFGDTRIAAGILNAFRVLEGSMPCNGYNRHVRKMFLPARPMNQSEAIFAAKMNIQEYRPRQGFRGNEHESRFESVSEYRFKTFGFQPAAQEFAKHRIIFDNENAMLHPCPPGLTTGSSNATTNWMRQITSCTNEQEDVRVSPGGGVIRNPIKTAMPVGKF
jgi:hypothetical protein